MVNVLLKKEYKEVKIFNLLFNSEYALTSLKEVLLLTESCSNLIHLNCTEWNHSKLSYNSLRECYLTSVWKELQVMTSVFKQRQKILWKIHLLIEIFVFKKKYLIINEKVTDIQIVTFLYNLRELYPIGLD